MLVKDICDLIGNTPLLLLPQKLHGLKNINVYAKLELFNPFGSVKDRAAWNMLRHDLETIKENNQTVIESSSGNMAKAMQVICSMHDVPLKIVTNRVRVREVKQVLQMLGTQIDELPGLSQCLDPTDPNDPVTIIEREISANPGKYFHTSQYTNERNVEAHYLSTGKEIHRDLDGEVDFYFGGLGTTGSTQGAGRYLKENNAALKNIGVIASKDGFLPGIRNVDEMYEVGLFKKDFYDDVVVVDIDESLEAMFALIKGAGVLAGPTGGACLAGVIKYLKDIDGKVDRKHNAVFLVCDRVEWYITYLQKYKPELFGLSRKKNSIKDITQQQVESAPELDTNEAEAWLRTDPVKPLVVDLRGGIAFKASHIENSINIPAEQLEEIAEWGTPFSTDQQILFVCPVGDQSKKFAAFFSARGLRCKSLKGGFVAWRDDRKPTRRAAVTKGEPALSALR